MAPIGARRRAPEKNPGTRRRTAARIVFAFTTAGQLSVTYDVSLTLTLELRTIGTTRCVVMLGRTAASYIRRSCLPQEKRGLSSRFRRPGARGLILGTIIGGAREAGESER